MAPLRWSLVALVAVAVTAGAAWGSPYTDQKAALSKVSRSLRAAERFAAGGRGDEAAEAFAAARAALESAATGLDSKLERSFERAKQQLEESRQKLTQAGIAVGDAVDIAATMATGEGEGGPTGETVSFTREIGPLLVASCGRCHVQGSRGGLSMRSYAELMRGGEGGSIIEIGAGSESLLVQRIAEGSMPPNPAEAPSPQQTARLVRWINQGAKFDGTDPNAALDGGAPTDAPPPASMPELEATKPRGNETVSFALDVAPILSEHCLTCHNQGQQRGGLSLGTFADLLEGGDTGAVLVAGKADESLLVQKVRGTAAEGARMPLNAPALDDTQIATIVTWISEGASIDGDPAQPLARVTAVARADKATPDELAVIRREAAQRQWRLALPDEQSDQQASTHFHVVGNVGNERLTELATLAEAEVEGVRQALGWTPDEWVKGPITIYAFTSRIDYAEFGTMVERRELDRGSSGHAYYDVVEPYLALVVNPDDAELPVRLCELVAQIAVADRGQAQLPQWFVEGSGRAVTARQYPRAAIVKTWRETLPSALAAMNEPADLLEAKLAPTTQALLSFAYIEDIRAKGTNYDKLLAAVAEGKSLDEASLSVYKLPLEQLTAAWLKSRQRDAQR